MKWIGICDRRRERGKIKQDWIHKMNQQEVREERRKRRKSQTAGVGLEESLSECEHNAKHAVDEGGHSHISCVLFKHLSDRKTKNKKQPRVKIITHTQRGKSNNKKRERKQKAKQQNT